MYIIFCTFSFRSWVNAHTLVKISGAHGLKPYLKIYTRVKSQGSYLMNFMHLWPIKRRWHGDKLENRGNSKRQISYTIPKESGSFVQVCKANSMNTFAITRKKLRCHGRIEARRLMLIKVHVHVIKIKMFRKWSRSHKDLYKFDTKGCWSLHKSAIWYGIFNSKFKC